MMLYLRREEKGFTITELMMATIIFASVLMILMFGVMSFSNRYYKGVNSSLTQSTARAALETISQAVQFGSATVTPLSPGNNYFCAGGYVFVFNSGGKMFTGTTSSTNQGLYMTPMSSTTCSPVSVPTSNGKQLLADRMRISNLKMTLQSSTLQTYAIEMVLAYGDNDLLCAPVTAGGSCGSSAPALADTSLANASDVQCKGRAGSQFCATSRLKTVVQKRVN